MENDGIVSNPLEPSRISNPLWSLTDGIVEKREWSRDNDFTSCPDSNTCSSSLDDFISHACKNSRKYLPNYSKEFDNGNDDNDGDGGGGGVDDWDVRSSIGLDSTLEFEEEDTYDKVAIGRENPHANHYAARIRLREDAMEATTQAEVYKGGKASRAEKYSSAAAEDNDKVKPILKRKEQKSTSRQSKRVRFNPGCINNNDGGGSAETMK